MDVDDDPSAKRRHVPGASRARAYGSLFVLGLCLGIVLSERMYMAGRSGTSTSTGASTQRSRLQEVSSTTQQAESSTAPRNELEALLQRIAPDKELIMAVANKNTMWDSMLDTFTQGFHRAGIKNHLVLALDQETKAWCEQHGINAYLLTMQIHKAQEGTGDNHAVSAMKFGILKQFIELGYSVLLTDVDVAIFANPFEGQNLYRDSDIEGMTDGFDERTAYGSIEGFDDPSMGWGRFAQYYKHFNMNSGLFYVRANNRTLELMTRLDDRLSKTKYWDQTAYNEEMFFLSHGDYKSPQVSVRVMDVNKYMNSKILFKDVRKRPKWSQPPRPIMVHINYHPDKHERLKAVIKYYWDKDEHALDPFPGGSEAGSR